jgi:hypothetical protein
MQSILNVHRGGSCAADNSVREASAWAVHTKERRTRTNDMYSKWATANAMAVDNEQSCKACDGKHRAHTCGKAKASSSSSSSSSSSTAAQLPDSMAEDSMCSVDGPSKGLKANGVATVVCRGTTTMVGAWI